MDDEAAKYTLHLAGYSGDAGDGFNDPTNPITNCYGMPFSTMDQVNSPKMSNCAEVVGGGWWFNDCTYGATTGSGTTFYWHPLGGMGLTPGDSYGTLVTSRMMIQLQP